MADETKLQEERIKAQKGLNKQFKALTTKLAETDESLGKTAANLRTNSKVTFEGFLSSRKLAKATAEAANDPQLLEAIQKSAELNDAMNNRLDEERLNNETLKSANDEMHALDEVKFDLLSRGISLIQIETDQFQDRLKNQKIIDEEEKSVREAFTDRLKISAENEEKQRDRLETKLKESTENESFGRFSSRKYFFCCDKQ